ncbi:chemotaxis-specific protein-glutamate methyltransferase CheB [Halovivax gelatinilyticus]|uniref:chemotaxis-specific protein-glutamate methyltransferase CheB n=1 Tax=Halovivax gelatinilyticus TaxID=2961597 RepID=UPI0020CA81B8|nr:chemotaxis-specific protein-glutamate methyltransferase CheB [Halovivax gelatinilyticus]
MTRVLVVDDSRFVRTVVGDALSGEGYDVETAPDGETALESLSSFDPDVVTMDIDLPGLDGLETIERIMSTNPTPIVVVSVYAGTDAEESVDALSRGAMDVIEKPDGSNGRSLTDLTNELVETVAELADATLSSLALARTSASANRTRSREWTTDRERSDRRSAEAGSPDPNSSDTATTSIDDPAFEPRNNERTARSVPDPLVPTRVTIDGTVTENPLIVIGASTGGPKLIEYVLASLPRALDARVIVVQHMPPEFTSRFAERLDEASEYAVAEAASGTWLSAGDAVVAQGGSHLVVAEWNDGDLRLECRDGDRVHGVRPSIDVTMESVASTCGGELIGVVLTGMGRDGVRGIEAISDAGGTTFAQDERTCPVFGIPRRTIEAGVVDEVVPIDRLPKRLAETLTIPVSERSGGVETNG